MLVSLRVWKLMRLWICKLTSLWVWCVCGFVSWWSSEFVSWVKLWVCKLVSPWVCKLTRLWGWKLESWCIRGIRGFREFIRHWIDLYCNAHVAGAHILGRHHKANKQLSIYRNIKKRRGLYIAGDETHDARYIKYVWEWCANELFCVSLQIQNNEQRWWTGNDWYPTCALDKKANTPKGTTTARSLNATTTD